MHQRDASDHVHTREGEDRTDGEGGDDWKDRDETMGQRTGEQMCQIRMDEKVGPWTEMGQQPKVHS